MQRLTPMDPHSLAPLVTASGEDCWNQTGVWGNQTPRCSRLQEVIHCRNCDVFTQAGRRLFENAANLEYVGEWADSKSIAEVQESVADNSSYTVFRLGNEWLALRTRMVKEVSEIGVTHCLPHRNKEILKGLMSVHGQLVPWISLEGLMGIAQDDAVKNGRHRCIVIESHQHVFVFSVAQVHGVMQITANSMREAPAALVVGGKKLLTGVVSWLEHDVGCLDGNALVGACNEHLL